jgi:hypothetical protein
MNAGRAQGGRRHLPNHWRCCTPLKACTTISPPGSRPRERSRTPFAADFSIIDLDLIVPPISPVYIGRRFFATHAETETENSSDDHFAVERSHRIKAK